MRRVAISGSAGGFDLPGRGERDFAAITAGAPLNPAGHRVKVTTRRSHNSPAILSSPERLRTPSRGSKRFWQSLNRIKVRLSKEILYPGAKPADRWVYVRVDYCLFGGDRLVRRS